MCDVMVSSHMQYVRYVVKQRISSNWYLTFIIFHFVGLVHYPWFRALALEIRMGRSVKRPELHRGFNLFMRTVTVIL